MITLDTLICGDNPANYQRLNDLCRSVFSSPAGRELLGMLNAGVPPMFPSVRPGENNDPVVVAHREGLREFSALLYRYAGNPQPHQPEPKTTTKRRHG